MPKHTHTLAQSQTTFQSTDIKITNLDGYSSGYNTLRPWRIKSNSGQYDNEGHVEWVVDNTSDGSKFNWNLKSILNSLSISNNGSSSAHENRPPYYALCFIMRIQ